MITEATYSVDIDFTGSFSVEIKANSPKEAYAKALNNFHGMSLEDLYSAMQSVTAHNAVKTSETLTVPITDSVVTRLMNEITEIDTNMDMISRTPTTYTDLQEVQRELDRETKLREFAR